MLGSAPMSSVVVMCIQKEITQGSGTRAVSRMQKAASAYHDQERAATREREFESQTEIHLQHPGSQR